MKLTMYPGRHLIQAEDEEQAVQYYIVWLQEMHEELNEIKDP